MNEVKIAQLIAEDTLTITLPDELKGKLIEVTVKELTEIPVKKRKKLQELLKQTPIWEEDEKYREYLEEREYESQWDTV